MKHSTLHKRVVGIFVAIALTAGVGVAGTQVTAGATPARNSVSTAHTTKAKTANTAVLAAARKSVTDWTIRTGRGLPIGGWYFGDRYVTVNGVRHYLVCLYISGGVPKLKKLQTLTTLGNIEVLSGKKIPIGTLKSQELKTIMTHEVAGISRSMGAAIYMAENTIAGVDSTLYQRAAKHAPAAVKKEASKLVAEAKRYHGTSSLTLHITKQATYVGQVGTFVAHAANNPAGRVVSFMSSANAVVTASAKTNANSDAVGHYVLRNQGSGAIYAVAKGLTPSTLAVGNYTRGYQEMVTSSPLLTLHARVSYSAVFNTTTASATCTSTCTSGTNVPITLTQYCNHSDSPYRLIPSLNGKPYSSKYTITIKAHTCTSYTWYGNNGQRFVLQVEAYVGGHWGTPTTLVNEDIDCPPALKLIIVQKVSCVCNQIVVGGYSNTIGAPIINSGNTTVTFTYSDKNGNASKSYTVNPGHSIPALAKNVHGNPVDYTIVETINYATHAGARTLIIHGVTTLS